MKISPVRLGVTFGLVLAATHASWLVLVITGWAQKVTDFVFWAHFIKPVFQIEPFELGRGAILLVLTFTSGAVMGSISGLLWNSLATKE